MQKTVERRDAQLIGMVFANLPQVSSVEVFGSVAREGIGNDLDMALTVDAVTYASYVLTLYKMMEGVEYDDCYFNLRSERLEVARQVLKFTTPLREWLDLTTTKITLDLHLFPQGWKEHVDEIQTHFQHDDPVFVSNIAKDAVALKFVEVGQGFVTTKW